MFCTIFIKLKINKKNGIIKYYNDVEIAEILELIRQFKTTYLNSDLNLSSKRVKFHLLSFHVRFPQFIAKYKVTPFTLGEADLECNYQNYNKFYANYGHQDKQLMKCMINFSACQIQK